MLLFPLSGNNINGLSSESDGESVEGHKLRVMETSKKLVIM